MRIVTTLCCTLALTALVASGVRADEFNKQTFLTFSGPVQAPGVMLPAGTYMFKLADPNGDRRTMQIWDKDGKKLYTTLMTIPNRRSEAPSDPVVMFKETPAGQPQAIQAWWYPGESYGQEFLYPKDQALKLAKANHEKVATIADDSKKVGHIDENGAVSDESGSAQASAAPRQNEQPKATASASASANTAPPAATTTAPAAPRSASASTAPAPADNTSAARTRSKNRADSSRPVATSGSTAAASSQNNNTAGTPARRTLPRTASSLELVELLSGLSLAGALSVRQLRRRFARA